MIPVYKHSSGHVVGAQANSNGPMISKMKHGFVSRVMVRCRSAYHKSSTKAELNSKFLCFLKYFNL